MFILVLRKVSQKYLIFQYCGKKSNNFMASATMFYITLIEGAPSRHSTYESKNLFNMTACPESVPKLYTHRKLSLLFTTTKRSPIYQSQLFVVSYFCRRRRQQSSLTLEYSCGQIINFIFFSISGITKRIHEIHETSAS